MKVLIVDDDFVSLELLRNALEESGFEVDCAENGTQAWELIQTNDYRLIITDWDMPGMNGVDLCRKARNQASNGYVYIILLTSHGASENIVEGMTAGADDFMVKPFDHAELLVRIRAGERILSLETRELAIFAMAKLAESRDTDTGHHLERVQHYSRVLAKYLSRQSSYASFVDDELVRLIYQTSPLHDIGKVGIPDAVLLKPGRLSDEEFEIMKTHTILGANTLNAALAHNPRARFLEVARDIALAHHERFDGKGYPLGLVGTNIPLAARIVAVADVYDALTSKRVYKGAYSHVVARDIIIKDSGTHFDPEVVKAFQETEQDFIAISESFREDCEQSAAHPTLSSLPGPRQAIGVQPAGLVC